MTTFESPARRSTDRGIDCVVVSPEAARLYFRRRLQNPADFPPAPGDVQFRDQILPDPSTLEEAYRPAFDLANRFFPMRAVYLRELADRVRSALDTYRKVFREEEERLQNKNEEARRADERIDSLIAQERAKCRAELAEVDQNLDHYLAVWEESRERIAEICALHDLDPKEIGRIPDGVAQEPDVSEADEGLTASANGHVDDSARIAPRGLFQRLRGIMPFKGRATDGSEGSDHSQASHVSPNVQTTPGTPNATPDLASSPNQNNEWTRVTGAATESPRVNGDPEASDQPINGSAPAEPATLPTELRYVQVEFPRSEATLRAPSAEALAARLGLIYPETAEANTRWSRFWHTVGKMFAILVFGSIFGFSAGVLLGLLDPKIMSIDWRMAQAALVVCLLAGTSVFWAIGKGVAGVTSTICEYVYCAFLASIEDERHTSVRFHGLIRWIAFVVGTVAILGLVAIEALVERHGIVEVFASARANRALLQGTSVTDDRGLGVEYYVLSLIASVPFVLLYAVTEWRDTMARCIRSFLASRRELAIHELATEIHKTRHEEAVKHRGGEVVIVERSVRLPSPVTSKSERSDETAGQDVSLHCPANRYSGSDSNFYGTEEYLPQAAQSPSRENSHANPNVGLDAVPDDMSTDVSGDGSHYTEVERLGAEEQLTSPHANRLLDPRVQAVAEASRLEIRRRNAWCRLDRLRKEKAALVKARDERIATLESQRSQEIRELPEQGYRRLESAYERYVAASRCFDLEYQKLARDVERKRRGGHIWRLKEAVLARPVTDDKLEAPAKR